MSLTIKGYDYVVPPGLGQGPIPEADAAVLDALHAYYSVNRDLLVRDLEQRQAEQVARLEAEQRARLQPKSIAVYYWRESTGSAS